MHKRFNELAIITLEDITINITTVWVYTVKFEFASPIAQKKVR
jgi:hypothetical protein